MKKKRVVKRKPKPPTSGQFMHMAYGAYRRGKPHHRSYLKEVYRLLFGKDLPAEKWSTLAAREIHYKLLADEAGGIMNLSPVLRRGALICRGRGKWTSGELFHMSLAEASLSNILAETENKEREQEMNTYALDNDNIESYAEWIANVGITQKGFERIMNTEEEKLSAATKKAGLKAFKAFLALDVKDRASLGGPKDVTPWGLQQLLMRAGKQAKLTAFLNQPGNLSVNPEHKAASNKTQQKTKKTTKRKVARAK
jgi:hypothetical protein